MKDNVIDLFKENSGYVTEDESKVIGVYNEGLAAINDGEFVDVGKKIVTGISNPIRMKKTDLDKFCIMWLLINNPECLKFQEE